MTITLQMISDRFEIMDISTDYRTAIDLMRGKPRPSGRGQERKK